MLCYKWRHLQSQSFNFALIHKVLYPKIFEIAFCVFLKKLITIMHPLHGNTHSKNISKLRLKTEMLYYVIALRTASCTNL